MSIPPQDRPGGQPMSVPSAQQFVSSTGPSPASSHRHSDECPACRAPVQPGQAMCVTYGTVLHSEPKQIRCRSCGKKGSSAYTLCPHCGRTLVAAPPLWLSWGLPGVLVLLFVLVLVSRMESGPLQWLGQDTGDGAAAVENPVLTPVREEIESTNVGEIGLADVGPPPPTEDASVAMTEADLLLVQDSPTETATPTPTSTPTLTPTLQPTDTAESTATATASPLPTETPTPPPPATLTPSPTSTAASRTYRVQEGDTPISIAERFQVTVADLLNVNQLSPAQALLLKPGTSLEIPGAKPLEVAASVSSTATLRPTASSTSPPTQTLTGTPTPLAPSTLPDQQRYTVVSGDTLVGIALRFKISTDALLTANGLTINDARELQLGQNLIIPATGQPLPPTATATLGMRKYTVQTGDTIVAIAARNGISTNQLLAANRMTAAQAPNIRPGEELLIPPPGYVIPAPTPRPTARPTAAPTPTPTLAIRLNAPIQIDPAPDINVSCSNDSEQYVRWNPVNGLAPGDEYVLFLGYVNSDPDSAGNVHVVPLLKQRTRERTNWQMDRAYCDVPPQTFGRRWRWYVQVFNGDLPVSPPSEVREFTWR